MLNRIVFSALGMLADASMAQIQTYLDAFVLWREYLLNSILMRLAAMYACFHFIDANFLNTIVL
jgi:hypothetical protein